MIYEVTNKPESPEGETWGDSVTIDQAGFDIRFNDGRVYTANYGEHLPEDVAMAIIEADFNEAACEDRVLIARTIRDFADKLERKCS